MSWKYEQATGYLYSPQDDFVDKGYAGGNCGKSPQGRNNTSMENVPDVGPLPRGTYTMGTPVEGTHLGPFAISLAPDPANQMFGRSGFYVHGDRIMAPNCASDGCIVMARDTRNLLAASTDKVLEVV